MMKRNDSEKVLLQKNFIAGTYNLTHTTNRLWTLEGGAIFFCRQGTASVNVDLKDYQRIVLRLLPVGDKIPGPVSGSPPEAAASGAFRRIPARRNRQLRIRRSGSVPPNPPRAIDNRGRVCYSTKQSA